MPSAGFLTNFYNLQVYICFIHSLRQSAQFGYAYEELTRLQEYRYVGA